MPRFFSAILLLVSLVASAASAAPESPPSLLAANAAYFQMRVAHAERMFTAIAEEPGSTPNDKAGAERGLARIQWLIDGDAKAAKASLDRALAAGADLCASTRYEVSVLRESGGPEAAADLAVARATACQGAALTNALLIERGKSELAWAQGAEGTSREAALARTAATMAALSPLGALVPDAARVKLGLALETSDAAAALDAWRAFFWLTDHNAPQSFHADDQQVAATFRDALGSTPSLAAEIAFERLLIRAGFYAEAQRFDARRHVGERAASEPAYQPVAAYFTLRRRFDAATLAFNRKHARGGGDGAAYEKAAEAMLADAAAGLPGKEPRTALRAAFGLHWMIGETGGVASVHIGHVVEDTRYQVVQFGRRGEVQFVSIDNLLSNGYQSWLWDGDAATGGWSELGGIVQIRSSYTPDALLALASFDPIVAAKAAADMVGLRQRDAEALKAKPVVFLPALQARLAQQSREQVAAKARAEAARTGAPYERTFLKTYWDAEIGHSIYIHEGRHALDHLEFTGLRSLWSPELEFRAKLSEIELADFPRMPLKTILSADIGDDTAHGIADARIMEGLRAWIERHPAEVSGFDPAVPAAEQIDKLSDDQMRQIAHDLDPYFKEHPLSAAR
jgi:hypothetical protein